MSEKKRKYAYWMYPSMVDEIAGMLPAANATSKGDFVCKAVNFYLGYLRQEKNINYLAPVLSGAIKGEIESVERHLCEMLFKVAVEQAKLSHVVAWQHEVADETMDELHDYCCRETAETNGILSFEEAYEMQHGDA